MEAACAGRGIGGPVHNEVVSDVQVTGLSGAEVLADERSQLGNRFVIAVQLVGESQKDAEVEHVGVFCQEVLELVCGVEEGVAVVKQLQVGDETQELGIVLIINDPDGIECLQQLGLESAPVVGKEPLADGERLCSRVVHEARVEFGEEIPMIGPDEFAFEFRYVCDFRDAHR